MADGDAAASNLVSAPATSVADAKPEGSSRGVAGSRRSWKVTQPRRASALVKLTGGSPSNSFAVQKVHRLAMDRAKEIAQRLREQREAEKKAEQEKRTDKKRRRAENELRSASYQVISDPTKLKKMSKKQLRSIKRTRLNPETGVVEFVGAYSRG